MKKIFQMQEQSQKEAGVKDGKELHIRKNDWILIVILLVAAYIRCNTVLPEGIDPKCSCRCDGGRCGIWEISTLGRSYRNHPL